MQDYKDLTAQYSIEVGVSSLNGLNRKFHVNGMYLQMKDSSNPKFRNYTAPFVMVEGDLYWYDLEDNVISSIEPKSYKFVANSKLADPSDGRIIAALVEDTDENSPTFGQMIPDPNFNPTVHEFILLADSPVTGGNTLWDEISSRIINYLNLVDSYGRFE